jgi:hypothetical protein
VFQWAYAHRTPRGVRTLARCASGLSRRATAASVVVETRCDKYGCRDSLVYSAARGERNDVTVAEKSDLVTVRDAAGIQPGGACEAIDAVSVRCTLQSFTRHALFKLGDQADQLDARGLVTAAPRIEGGAGDDRLVGPEAGGALFVGGAGDHEMTGGPGSDRFETRRPDGADTIAGGGPPPLLDADAFPGRDEIFYEARVVLDGRPNDGARGEHDNLLSIESVYTGGGDDVVIGTAMASTCSAATGTICSAEAAAPIGS